MVCGDFFFFEPFTLKISKYAYKMVKCIWNIPELSKTHELFESNCYELDRFLGIVNAGGLIVK